MARVPGPSTLLKHQPIGPRPDGTYTRATTREVDLIETKSRVPTVQEVADIIGCTVDEVIGACLVLHAPIIDGRVSRVHLNSIRRVVQDG